MGKFFLVIGILFVMSLLVTILAGNLAWQNVKDASITVKESFHTIAQNISKTQARIRDAVLEVFKKEKGSP